MPRRERTRREMKELDPIPSCAPSEHTLCSWLLTQMPTSSLRCILIIEFGLHACHYSLLPICPLLCSKIRIPVLPAGLYAHLFRAVHTTPIWSLSVRLRAWNPHSNANSSLTPPQLTCDPAASPHLPTLFPRNGNIPSHSKQ